MKPTVRFLFHLLVAALCVGTAFWGSAVSNPARAAVTLASFTATGEDDRVRIVWETATELDNSGFYIWRSTSEDGTYTRISQFFPSQGDPLIGATYEYIDNDVANGTRYWYKLEAVDLSQNSDYFGPISAVPGEPTPTQTGTITITLTQTPTVTGTQLATATRTPTITSVAGTAYPAPGVTTTRLPATSVPQVATPVPAQALQTGTIQPSPLALTPTLTGTLPTSVALLSRLEITVVFPTEGIIIPARRSATNTPLPAAASGAPASGWSPWGGAMLLGMVVLIWVILGAWFYFSFRRLE